MSFFDSFKREVKNVLVFLIVIVMPYIGVILLLIFKPFSVKTRNYLYIYCVLISILVFNQIKKYTLDKSIESIVESTEFIDSIQISSIENDDLELNTSVALDSTSAETSILETQTNEVTETTTQASIEVKNAPNYREAIENKILKLYNEGLDFSFLNYMQWDPMEIDLYHCKSTFEGKLTKKKHNYLARVGFNRETEESTLYYLSIDGETILWDEEGEDSFFDRK